MRTHLTRFVSLMIAVACVHAHAETVPGWFWYNDPPPEITTEPIEPDAPQTPPPMPMMGTDAAPSYSTAWIRDNLPVLRDRAIDTPSPENVRAYLYVQRLALDRASEFQSAVSFVTSADPYLDQVTRFPTSAKGVAVGERLAERGREDTLFDLSSRAGIWFFYRSDCQYCHEMVGILLMLERKYGFSITPISLDGQPLDPRLPRFVIDRGQGAQLGVEATPSMFLVRPPDLTNIVPIAQGFVSLGDMEERIVRMAYYRGWISEAQYNSTRIATPMRLNPSDSIEQTMDPAEIVRQLRPTHAATSSPDMER